MAANNAAAIQLAIDDCCRMLVMVHEVMANPTQSGIDAVIAAAAGTSTLVPRPSYSDSGVSYQWQSYRESLEKSVESLTKLLTVVTGPFMVHSRAR